MFDRGSVKHFITYENVANGLIMTRSVCYLKTHLYKNYRSEKTLSRGYNVVGAPVTIVVI